MQPVYDNKRRLILIGSAEIPATNPWFHHILRDLRHGKQIPGAVLSAAGSSLDIRFVLPEREFLLMPTRLSVCECSTGTLPRLTRRCVIVQETDKLAFDILNSYACTIAQPDQTLLVAIFYYISKQHRCATSSQQ